MVHLIVAKGPDDAIEAVKTRVSRSRDGWLQLVRGVWFMGSDHAPDVLRDVLSHFGAEILVIQLRRTWATKGFRRTTNWLRTQREVF